MPTFRTKARAIDLLGKGQIADLPTAISELWKNGYDAYADILSCDLYLPGSNGISSPIFTLSDNGLGMSEKDLIEKWIVIGTESKAKSISLSSSESDTLGKPERIPMGEKGIGRLSAAFLGNQMLMLTKKAGMDCLSIFIDWRIFENYNLYIEDVNIPISTIDSQNDFYSVFKLLVNDFSKNLKSGNWAEHKKLCNDISDDLVNLVLPEYIEKSLTKFFNDNYHGTIFIIFHPNELLIDLSKGSKKSQSTALDYLRSFLSGINNTFVGESNFETHFWIHGNRKYDIIDKEEFFTRDEMINADHFFHGRFDENGQFTGEVRIFNKRLPHTFKPNRTPGLTPYGPFEIEFGFMEGEAKSSIHTKDEWLVYSKKLDKFGGLYIYRDGFRVLPYGKKEYDFLKFEERRSFRAGDFFFSHRRMFGYIGISRNNNSSLKDKAGREGFISNQAYREFQNDLIEFFIDLAFKYLNKREDNPRSKYLREQELKKQQEKAAAEEKKRNKALVLEFKKKLIENQSALEELKIQVENNQSILNKNNVQNDEINNIAINIKNIKYKYNDLKLSQPPRLQLTDTIVNDYYQYIDKYDTINKIINKCNETLLSIKEKVSKDVLNKELTESNLTYLNELKKYLYDYRLRVQKKNKWLIDELEKDTSFYSQFYLDKTKQILNSNNDQDVKDKILLIEQIFQNTKFEIEGKYQPMVNHIEGLDFSINDDLLIGWYKDQNRQLNEKVEAMYELAQLGMAIEIIDHQFNVLYSQMTASINYFKNYPIQNDEFEVYYKQLRTAFEHLETNHKLLTPLYRTTRRNKIIIKGSDIRDYINKFFDLRFKNHDIRFTTDINFDNYEFYTYESIIKPVFINIINNALYWLTSKNDRRIHITLLNDEILILNSGTRIDTSDEEKIFNLFYTKKPGGRGIGLYLARTNLQTIGYEIEASNDPNLNLLGGACFIIRKKGGDNNDDRYIQ